MNEGIRVVMGQHWRMGVVKMGGASEENLAVQALENLGSYGWASQGTAAQ